MHQTADLTTLARLHVGLLEVAAIVQSTEDVPHLLEAIARTISTSLGWGAVAINLYRPAWNDLEVQTVYGSEAAAAALLGDTTEWDTWAPLMSEAFERRGAHLVPDGEFDWSRDDTASYMPDFEPRREAGAWNPGDALFAAMRGPDGALLGILSVDDPATGRCPTDHELDALVAVAGHAALAVRHSLDVALVRRHRAALEHFLEIFAHHRDTTPDEELLAAVCAGFRVTLGFERVDVELLPDGDRAPLAAVLDRRHEHHGGYLMTAAEAAALAPGVDFGPPSERSGRGPLAWRDHRLFLPLLGASGALAGIVVVRDPSDRLLPSVDSLHAVRVFADQAAMMLEAAARLEALRHLADHDPLTGLGNRRAFMAALDSESARARRHGGRFTLVVCDVDGLKALNDRAGHAAGDDALCHVGRVLEESLRRSDGAYRIGGDEFALVLVDGPDGGHAGEVTRRIESTLAHPVEAGALPIAMSFGAVVSLGEHDPELVLRRADEIMYQAKRAGSAG